MKFWNIFKREPQGEPGYDVDQDIEARLALLEQQVEDNRKKIEATQRKVYRDIDKMPPEAEQPVKQAPNPLKRFAMLGPGDPVPPDILNILQGGKKL